MNLVKMLEEGMIESIPVNKDYAKQIFQQSKADIKAAEDSFTSKNLDWTLVISYNAMLRAARALMFLKGYRPKGEYKHLAVVKFIESEGGKLSKEMVVVFNRMRIKRHRAVYDEPEAVSESEAKNANQFAKEFVEKIGKEFA
ncbi:HEPN domain-containing protein [Candidatus Micrarchaeota archaeon]|nr:HEPN domain-containing protein [Candidatus Micrarchaeota archaeon]